MNSNAVFPWKVDDNDRSDLMDSIWQSWQVPDLPAKFPWGA